MSDKAELNLANEHQLHFAVVTGQLETVEQILNKNPSLVHCIDEEGTTPLILASANGHLRILKNLILRGADIDHKRKTGTTALFFAAQDGHLSVVQELLRNGASVSHSSYAEEACTPLFVASQCGHLDVVKELISYKAPLNIPMKDGATPLFVASQNGNTEIVLCLIDHGASVDKLRKDKTSALWIASQMGHNDVVQLLLRAGALVDQSREDGSTPLFKACHKGHAGVVEHLLHHMTKPELGLLKNGESPLHGACLFGHTNVVKLLIESGAQINLRNQVYLKRPDLTRNKTHPGDSTHVTCELALGDLAIYLNTRVMNLKTQVEGDHTMEILKDCYSLHVDCCR